MLTNKDYCDYETCVALKELGYNHSSEYTFCKHCRVSDEILEKYDGLSDSGYLDLVDEYGGPYKRDEVYKQYIEPLKRWSRNTMLDEMLGELCSCVHLYNAQKWLRETHNIFVMIDRSFAASNSWHYVICVNDDFEHLIEQPSLENYSYEEALSEGIKEAIKILKDGI